jgi:hypothetical protein
MPIHPVTIDRVFFFFFFFLRAGIAHCRTANSSGSKVQTRYPPAILIQVPSR